MASPQRDRHVLRASRGEGLSAAPPKRHTLEIRGACRLACQAIAYPKLQITTSGCSSGNMPARLVGLAAPTCHKGKRRCLYLRTRSRNQAAAEFEVDRVFPRNDRRALQWSQLTSSHGTVILCDGRVDPDYGSSQMFYHLFHVLHFLSKRTRTVVRRRRSDCMHDCGNDRDTTCTHAAYGIPSNI
ncbi:hypothetical protein EJ03DRAFT_162101 [Teratosphaeria nubilosa]|uniref:Uncharacterized protein n=1 Tax=Teratosphaeria nubilosa TaxID=161662 RepID=A0A6G1L2E3_9PEZI|nr:hypothetical protein EJ03DRAFT_162101 [Teratosphaeria nubilosa]